VYGSVLEGFSKETDCLKPNSPYAATKAAADLLALSYHSTYNLPVIVTRSSNNFGPFQYTEKLIPLFITNLLVDKKVPIYGDGKNSRDWIYVIDNCKALDLVLHEGEIGEIYNIGGGNYISNLDLTNEILSMMEKDIEAVQYVNDRPGHDKRYALDSEKIKKLGWSANESFKDRLVDTIKWYEENEKWWKTAKSKAEIIS